MPGRNSTAHFLLFRKKNGHHRFSQHISSTKAKLVSEIQQKATVKKKPNNPACFTNWVVLSLTPVTTITPPQISSTLIIPSLLYWFPAFLEKWWNNHFRFSWFITVVSVSTTRSFRFGVKKKNPKEQKSLWHLWNDVTRRKWCDFCLRQSRLCDQEQFPIGSCFWKRIKCFLCCVEYKWGY